MDINATLLGQILTFILLVWFTMKFVWPPITNAMSEREKRIAEGLVKAEQSIIALQSAKEQASQALALARKEAAEILDRSHQKAGDLLEAAKQEAKQEGERLMTQAKNDIAREIVKAQELLKQQVAQLAIVGAEKILQNEIDQQKHAEMLEEFVAGL
jgi:F-type H+-transporting ATPase subunit b